MGESVGFLCLVIFTLLLFISAYLFGQEGIFLLSMITAAIIGMFDPLKRWRKK